MRGRETSMSGRLLRPLLGTWPTTRACPLDWESNQQPFGSQAGAQSTEPHRPGQNFLINMALFRLCYSLLHNTVTLSSELGKTLMLRIFQRTSRIQNGLLCAL